VPLEVQTSKVAVLVWSPLLPFHLPLVVDVEMEYLGCQHFKIKYFYFYFQKKFGHRDVIFFLIWGGVVMAPPLSASSMMNLLNDPTRRTVLLRLIYCWSLVVIKVLTCRQLHEELQLLFGCTSFVDVYNRNHCTLDPWLLSLFTLGMNLEKWDTSVITRRLFMPLWLFYHGCNLHSCLLHWSSYSSGEPSGY